MSGSAGMQADNDDNDDGDGMVHWIKTMLRQTISNAQTLRHR